MGPVARTFTTRCPSSQGSDAGQKSLRNLKSEQTCRLIRPGNLQAKERIVGGDALDGLELRLSSRYGACEALNLLCTDQPKQALDDRQTRTSVAEAARVSHGTTGVL